MKATHQSNDNRASAGSPPPTARLCPACGAYVEAGEGGCWFCERQLGPGDRRIPIRVHGESLTEVIVGKLGRPEPGLQFSLETLLVVTTLIAACLGISVAVPLLGIPLSVIAAGGLIRTLVVGKQYQRLGLPFPLVEKGTEFVVSCGVVVAAIGVALFTLAATGCLGGAAAFSLEHIRRSGGPSDLDELFSAALAIAYIGLAVGAPIGSMVWVFWATRPR
jgi:hypothetical protein